MSKHKKHKRSPQTEGALPLGEARGQKAERLHPVGPDGGGHGSIRPPAEEAFLHHVMPGQQKFAQAFLDGKSPGLMQRLAPDAATSDVEGWVESDATVERLAHWHREAPHG